jgi:hypothetical protein
MPGAHRLPLEHYGGSIRVGNTAVDRRQPEHGDQHADASHDRDNNGGAGHPATRRRTTGTAGHAG